MTNRDQVARILNGALPARETGGKDGAVIDTRTIKRAIGALGGTDMAKAPTKRKSGGSLAAAKARVAKLESAAKRKAAVAKASAGVKAARAALAAAKKLK